LVWREHQGPPIKPPAKTGTGVKLIDNAISSAKIRHDFGPKGYVCTVSIPLQHFSSPVSDTIE